MQIDGLKKALDEVGLPMHGVVYNKHWKVRLSSPKEETREASRKGLEDAMRESKAVGGTSVLLVPGKVGGKDETHEHAWSPLDRANPQMHPFVPETQDSHPDRDGMERLLPQTRAIQGLY